MGKEQASQKANMYKQSRSRKWSDYQPQTIEPKWQEIWETDGLYLAPVNNEKPKYYCLDFFPYPSGEGLHVGHCRNYIPTDVISRYKRMRGFNVLHPMGWDSFGEPAEQFAVAEGVHPRVITDQNTANYRRQMTIIGTSYDWTREIDSSTPEFYRWTQWFFLLLYRRGLAYRDSNWQWWCPTCQTTLSSHEAAGGICWRGHEGVTKREIPAWYFKITVYAEALLDGLDTIDWPERIKSMQRNWIGRSEGCEIVFKTEDGEHIPVFTTRPDTVYGTTYLILAPEHPLVERLTSDNRRSEVESYIAETTRLSEIDRLSETGEKTGVFIGGHAINPLSKEIIPVWIADYVLPTYGTGAVMGVPAHDQRDFDFAKKYNLPVKVVVAPEDYIGESLGEAFIDSGKIINSGPYNGMSNQEAGELICDYLEDNDLGGFAVQYRMRDWLISRQRYWGTPIPIVYCQSCGEIPVPEDDLPVRLPQMEDFTPDGSGRSPLARIPDFVQTTCPKCDGPAERETDTMGGFACSSWYYLRFTSPHYELGPFEPEAMQYWMPVDLYVGGAEHAVLHLLYSRFWFRVMADAGLLPSQEPFAKLLNQGQLMGPDGQRMSKSRGNVITPDHIVYTFGADSLRIYEMFMAPFDQDVNWNEDGINGAKRFLNRIWNLYRDTYFESSTALESDPEIEIYLHQTIKKVTERIEDFKFNTMVSALMEFVNHLLVRYRDNSWRSISFHQALETLIVLIAPAVPHIAEELWQLTEHEGSVHSQTWPIWDHVLVQDESIQIAVQIDGKFRSVVDILAHDGEDIVKKKALDDQKIQQHLESKDVLKVIYIPGKILNFITGTKR